MMKNLMHEHPSEDVRRAMVRLADALCMWERATSRHNLVIVKDSSGCEYRAMDGGPVPDDIQDTHLLEAFNNMIADEPPIL